MRKFGGFTESQIKAIADRMGYSGDISGFNEYLTSNPDKMAKLSRMVDTAKAHVQKYAKGGLIEIKAPVTGKTIRKTQFDPATDDTKKTEQKKQVAAPAKPPANGPVPSPRETLSTAINAPEKAITQTEVEKIDTNKNQLIDKNSGQLTGADPKATQEEAVASTAKAATQPETERVKTSLTSDKVNSATEDMQGVHGQVSENSQVTAAQALPSADATVQGQMSKLLAQFEGENTPAWAAGALRKANATMAARGLGASSMAGSATTQAAMESALGIAVQDAATYAQFEMKNLDNRQQAAVINAQSFLAMDMANLDNDQQAMLAKTQLRTQALFTDAAAANATKQFNATNENQANQFFASLKTQVSQFNAAQRTATSQFNADQSNQLDMFNQTIKDQRDQFNAQNRLIIDQANAKWRQTIATTDNANINEANRLDAQAATGLTTAAYNNIWQTQRDLITFAFTAGENQKQRAHELVVSKKQSKDAQEASLWEAAGTFVSEALRGWEWL